MECPHCNAQNPESARFCLNCGARVSLTCPRCDADLPLHARFCMTCGATVDQVAPTPPTPGEEPVVSARIANHLKRLVPREYVERLQATHGKVRPERRTVTMLFSDVTGSAAMAEHLDPEEVLEIMDGAFDLLIEPVTRHEGTLARLMGDAVLAFFGAPLSHEDDAERAVRAALEIIAGAKRYADRLERERGLSGFDVRVGIHTGLVSVGEVGSDLRVEYTAMGDAVNLAARMEQAAPPGGILITHDTYRHVRGVFDVQAQPPMMVKGRAEPVQSYLVQRAKQRAWRMGRRGVEGLETRMVGREAEMLNLQVAYGEVVADHETRVVTVVGEPGVGKSRLLDEFASWVDLSQEEVAFLRGRATFEARSVAYGLWRELFAYQFDILETDTAAQALAKFREGMADLLPAERADLVGHLVGFDFSRSPAVAKMLGSESFGRIASTHLAEGLQALAGHAPVLVVLEDLHWADDSSLDLLALLIGRLPHAPLLVVGAARPMLYERRPNWGEGVESFARLELRPLSRTASRALVREILQKVRQVPEEVQQLVVEGAEGNPFYAEELVNMLIEDGAIVPDEEAWQVDMECLARVRVPATLTAVLQARLDALPWEEKEVLRRASVVGREFWDSLVAELASDEVRREDIHPLLSSLRGREMVYRRERSALAGTEEYLFKHAVLRDVTYETVLLKLRRRYHAQVAAWLERHAGERLGEYLNLIAGHHELAGDGEKAAGYLRRSGEELFKVSGYRAARDTFERALALLPPPTSGAGEGRNGEGLRLRADLHFWLGLAQQYLDEWANASASLEAALELARQAGDRRMEGRALARLGHLASFQLNFEAAEGLLRESLALARETGDGATEALAARVLAQVVSGREAYEEATDLAEQSRVLYERAGDRRGLADALFVLAFLADAHEGDTVKGRRYYRDATALPEADGRTSAAILRNLGVLAMLEQETGEARRYLEQSRGVAQEIGARSLVAEAHMLLSRVAALEGAHAEARMSLEKAIAESEAIGDRRLIVNCRLDLGHMLTLQGQWDGSWAVFVRSVRDSLSFDNRLKATAVFAVGRAGVHWGRFEKAAELIGLFLDRHSYHPEAWAKRELDMLRAELPADELEAALDRGAALDVDDVVSEILACDTPEAFWGPRPEGAPGSSEAPEP